MLGSTHVQPLPSGSDAVFRALFEQGVLGVGQADGSGRILAANPRLCEMLGYTSAELLGLTLAQIIHPQSRAESQRQIRYLADGATSFVIETEYLRQDGSALWAATNVTGVRDEAGRLVSLLAFVLDVTDRRRAQGHSAFLSELTQRLASVRDEKEIVRTATEALGRHLVAQRIFFAECSETEGRLAVTEHRLDTQGASASASFSLAKLGGPSFWRAYARGDVAVFDTQHEPALPAELSDESARSYMVQALSREGGWKVTLTVTDDAPRAWRPDELLLLADLLARVWPLVERSRAEAALSAELEATEQLLVQRHQSEAKRKAADDLVMRITAESERRHRLYETILSHTPDLVYVFDLQRRFVYANAALLEAWGLRWGEAIGKTCLEVGYPDWQAAMHGSEIDQVVSSKRSIRGEVPFKAAQSERIHDYILVPVFGADGEVEAIAGTTRDVTALKQAEYLMAGQAQALELMVKGVSLTEVLEALCDVVDQQATERLGACILLMQDDGRHLRPAAGRHMPVEWLSSVDPWPIGPAHGSCGTAAHRREPVISSDISRDELWLDLKERAGRHGFRACWSTPIFSSAGAVLGTLDLYYPRVHSPSQIEMRLVEIVTRSAGIAIERKLAEDGLQRHSERLRLLWETAAVLLTTEDPEALLRGLFLRIAPHFELEVYFNHLLEESGEARLFSAAGLSSEHARSVAQLPQSAAIFGGVEQTHEPFELAFIQRSDDPAHALLKAMGLRAYACMPLTADDRLLGTLAFGSRQRDRFEADEIEFLRTVTHYVTVAYERLRLVRELREADRKKDDFIALLAHELRNPLAPLRNGLHVMRLASADSAAVGRARAIMERQLGHMVRLIDDLLDVSRISLNKMELRRSRVSLADIVSNAVETARPAFEGAGHQLEVALPDEPILLDADLTRLAQVLGNLLTNAAKYTPKHGRVRLSATVVAGSVVVSVADNGIGLQADSLRSIFGMFSQVDRSFERSTGGLGIGLALVKGLVEMHGGSVTAESPGVGQGSTFSVCLPLAAAVESQPEAAAEEPQLARRRRRILIADDNRDAVESMATMLRLSGNEVHTARDGLEALEVAEAVEPDVVLMDVGMPRLNGYEATRRLRGQSWAARTVVIAVTGWGQESDRRKSREAGCDYHLVKPVDFAQLDKLMSELCAKRGEAAPVSTSDARITASGTS
jgi:PAS domain S-box-containing protein